MKKIILTLLLCLGFTLGFAPLTVYAAGGTLSGEGTVQNPYLIEDKVDLLAFAEIVNGTNAAACGKVINSIGTSYDNLTLETEVETWAADNAITWTPMGTVNAPYTGTFTANDGVEIYGIKIDGAYNGQNMGFFGCVNGATIENVTLSGMLVCGEMNIGGIAGNAVDSTISGCTVKGSWRTFIIHGRETIGGIVGYAQDTYISDCKSEIRVWLEVPQNVTGDARHKVGGIAGMVRLTDRSDLTADKVLVNNCENTGCIWCKSENDNECTGGIVGRIVSDSADYKVVISACTNRGRVISIEAGTGGIVGYAYNTLIESCNNYELVTSSNAGTGGIVGIAKCCELNSCNNEGEINGKMGVGGIAGYANYGTDIIECHNKKEVTAELCYVGGIAGSVLCPRGMTYRDENSCEDVISIPEAKLQKDSLIEGCTNDAAITCQGDYEELGTVVVCNPSNGEPVAMAISGSYAGGIVGTVTDSVYFSEEGNTIYIKNCTNKTNGTVTGAKNNYTYGATYTGGILGAAKNSVVTGCSNEGTVVDVDVSASDTVRDDIGGYAYTVWLNADGGTVTPGLTIARDGKLDTLPTPSKTDYNFEGWYSGDTEYSAGAEVTGALRLTAKWMLIPQSSPVTPVTPPTTAPVSNPVTSSAEESDVSDNIPQQQPEIIMESDALGDGQNEEEENTNDVPETVSENGSSAVIDVETTDTKATNVETPDTAVTDAEPEESSKGKEIAPYVAIGVSGAVVAGGTSGAWIFLKRRKKFW